MTYNPNKPSRPQTSIGGTERELESNIQGAFEQVKDQAQDTFENVKDKAQDTFENVKDKAQNFGSQVSDKAESATNTIGEKMSNVAETIRQKAPTSGTLGDAANTTAQAFDRAGSYLQEQDFAHMRKDLEGLVRDYPVQSLLVGLGLGYLVARSTRR